MLFRWLCRMSCPFIMSFSCTFHQHQHCPPASPPAPPIDCVPKQNNTLSFQQWLTFSPEAFFGVGGKTLTRTSKAGGKGKKQRQQHSQCSQCQKMIQHQHQHQSSLCKLSVHHPLACAAHQQFLV